jgi:hypothetical protein
MDSQIFKEQLQRSKPNGLKSFLCHLKAIKTLMSKMGSLDPFGTQNTSYGQKKGQESN